MAIEFVNPLTAGTVLIRSDIRSQNFTTGVSGWRIQANGDAEFNSIVIRGGTVVSGLALYYNGTPAAGNLILSIAASAGTDSFGNAYLAGLTSYSSDGSINLYDNVQTFLNTAGAEISIGIGGAQASMLLGPPDVVGVTWTDGAIGTLSQAPNNTPELYLQSPYNQAHAGASSLILRGGNSVSSATSADLDADTLGISGYVDSYNGNNFGSWAVTVGNSGGATFSASSGGSYVRFGKLWFVQIYLVVATAGAGAGIVTVDVPFTIDRSKRQTLAMHTESTGPGGSHIGNGTCTWFVGGAGGTADRLRTSSNGATNADANITGADLLVGGIITIQGWLREA